MERTERNRWLEKLYVDWVVKSPVLFYSFLLALMAIFVAASMSLQLDVRQSFPATFDGNTITVDNTALLPGDVVHLYTERNVRVVSAIITSVEINGEGERTSLHIDRNTMLSGEGKIEAIVGKESLFTRIFIKAGRS